MKKLETTLLALVSAILLPGIALAASFIGGFFSNTAISSTVPGNGDVNPYGVAVVPASSGSLVQGNILVSNFNNINNLQGTGTTIVQITPGGGFSQFAAISPSGCPGGIGLTTALVA